MASWRRRLEPVKAVLEQLLGRLQTQGNAAQVALTIFRHWSAAVGEPIASHARPVALRGDVLWLEVDHAAWQHEMVYLGPKVAATVNARLGRPVVRQVRVRAAAPAATMAPAAAPSGQAGGRVGGRAEAADYDYAQAYSAPIADAEVRGAFEGMLAQLECRRRTGSSAAEGAGPAGPSAAPPERAKAIVPPRSRA